MVKASHLLVCTVILITTAYIYIRLFHRISSVYELSLALSTMALPTYDSRCKSVNSTHFVCLPNVLFIGASKCGTTSLTEYLMVHPRINFMRRRIIKKDDYNEVHRFDRNTYGYSIQSLERASEFASSPYVTNVNDPLIHYTPHYLYSPSTPFEAREFFQDAAKDVKLIVILRNPVKRAISSYWFKNSHLFHDHDQGNSTQKKKKIN